VNRQEEILLRDGLRQSSVVGSDVGIAGSDGIPRRRQSARAVRRTALRTGGPDSEPAGAMQTRRHRSRDEMADDLLISS